MHQPRTVCECPSPRPPKLKYNHIGRSDLGLMDIFWFKILPAYTTELDALPPNAE